MNTKIIGIIVLIIAIGGSSAYFLTKNDSSDISTSSSEPIYQNEKVGLVINTITPPKGIVDIEKSYKVASTSGIGRTNLYIHWDHLEPEKGNFDWRVTDIMMKLNEKYNLKSTLYFSVINADRLGPFPSWMGYQVIGKTLESDTVRVLNEILSRYENIDYVIFAADIDYHFQRAPGTIPSYTEFFNNISSEIKLNHPSVKIGNSLSLENIINKDMIPGGTFELTPQLVMGDFIALSYKPTDTIGDINRTPLEAIKDFQWMGNQNIGKSLEDDTIRVLDAILSRYENIDYVIFGADIDYHFQRAPGAIPDYLEFFNNISSEIKTNHPNVKIGNSMSLENIINKELFPNGVRELTPELEMGDFIALSYKPVDVVGDIVKTPQEAISDFERTLEMFPSQKLAFFEVSWSTSEFVNGTNQ